MVCSQACRGKRGRLGNRCNDSAAGGCSGSRLIGGCGQVLPWYASEPNAQRCPLAKGSRIARRYLQDCPTDKAAGMGAHLKTVSRVKLRFFAFEIWLFLNKIDTENTRQSPRAIGSNLKCRSDGDTAARAAACGHRPARARAAARLRAPRSTGAGTDLPARGP